jgi:putative effector of murein hydrolase
MMNVWVVLVVWAATLLAYIVGWWLSGRIRLSILNPFLIATILMIGGIVLLRLPYETYQNAGKTITWFLGPVVVMLAVPLYKSRKTLMTHFLPISAGILVGILVSAVTVYGLSRVFRLESQIVASLMPKSITNPMAYEVTLMFGGIPAITVAAVIITGVFGASVATSFFKVTGIRHDTAKGIALGAASHGIGTAKSIEISQEAGAASGLSMGLTGVATVLLASLIRSFFI